MNRHDRRAMERAQVGQITAKRAPRFARAQLRKTVRDVVGFAAKRGLMPLAPAQATEVRRMRDDG